MRIIQVAFLLICCAFFFKCSVNKQISSGDYISIIKEPKTTVELLNEPKRSKVILTFLDKENNKSVQTDVQLLVNNTQFLPDSNRKFNLNLFSGEYIFQAIGLAYDKRSFKLFMDEKYNYKISIKLNPNRTTVN